MPSTATEWLRDNPGDYEELEKVLLSEGVSASVLTEYPDWMRREIATRLADTFEQDYWADIAETTKGDANRVLLEGNLDGWSISRMAAEIETALGTEYAWNRAVNIARTESGNALNGARRAAMDRARSELPDDVAEVMRPVWHSVLGFTTRDSHAHLDGVPADDEGLWDLGGVRVPWPGHYTLPAGERCNCQCTVVMEYGVKPEDARQRIDDYHARVGGEEAFVPFGSGGGIEGSSFEKVLSWEDRFPASEQDPAPGELFEYHSTRAEHIKGIYDNGIVASSGANISVAPHLEAANFYGDVVDNAKKGAGKQAVLFRMRRDDVRVGYPDDYGRIGRTPTPEYDMESTREHVVTATVKPELLEIYYKKKWYSVSTVE